MAQSEHVCVWVCVRAQAHVRIYHAVARCREELNNQPEC